MEKIEGTDLIICLGGDGSMLWAARAVVPHAVPILGVNMGRLGFLAELGPQDLMAKLPKVLAGEDFGELGHEVLGPELGEEAEAAHVDAEDGHRVGDDGAGGPEHGAVAAEADDEVRALDVVLGLAVVPAGGLPDLPNLRGEG